MSQVWSILSNKVLSLSSEMLSKARAIVYIILVVSLTSVTYTFKDIFPCLALVFLLSSLCLLGDCYNLQHVISFKLFIYLFIFVHSYNVCILNKHKIYFLCFSSTLVLLIHPISLSLWICPPSSFQIKSFSHFFPYRVCSLLSPSLEFLLPPLSLFLNYSRLYTHI